MEELSLRVRECVRTHPIAQEVKEGEKDLRAFWIEKLNEKLGY